MFSALRTRINSFRSTGTQQNQRWGNNHQSRADWNNKSYDDEKPPRHPYCRPEFLDISYEAYCRQQFDSNEKRNILVLNDPEVLPWSAGYAE
jgi:hypothetical protein